MHLKNVSLNRDIHKSHCIYETLIGWRNYAETDQVSVNLLIGQDI